MENLEISHEILLAGSDFESCRQHVIRFFDRTMLIHYDEVLASEDMSMNGADSDFWSRLEQGVAANHQAIGELLNNLKVEGFATLEELHGVEKGYVSKTFHTIAHLLDGFIGIDSRFYNLEEDSHGISRDLRQKIQASPENYWLLRVLGRITSASEDPLDALRTFEWKGKGEK
ncbi:hypothetical protein ACFLYW_04440 [Thermodesulfobacteriota bacterium]